MHRHGGGDWADKDVCPWCRLDELRAERNRALDALAAFGDVEELMGWPTYDEMETALRQALTLLERHQDDPAVMEFLQRKENGK